MNTPVGASVIGCGNISGVHLRAISTIPQARPAWLYDTKPERAHARSAEFGGSPAVSFEQAIGDPAVTAVHVLTPHALHAPQALAALDAGKYVICEKPMATTIADAKSMIAADPEGTRLCVIFQNRYNASAEKAKELLDSKALGDIITIKAEMTWHRDGRYYSDDWHGTQALECGGVLINQAIHTIDMMLYLGGAPEAIKGSVTCDLLDGLIEVEENAHAVVRFQNGKVGLLYASNSFGVDESPLVQVNCEGGALMIRGGELYLLRDGQPLEALVTGQNAATVGKAVYGSGHIHQIREFYRCIQSGERFRIGAREAYNALWAVLGVYESSCTGKWVTYA